MAHRAIALSNWDRFQCMIKKEKFDIIKIDGNSLDLASIAAVARHSKSVEISDDCWARVKKSAAEVAAHLKAGDTIYAVNTGVGASADTRTNDVEDLQRAIIRTLNCGIIDDDEHEETVETLPITWTKAAQLVRTNALANGNSGIRAELLQSLVQLLQADIVPRTPLRGSISASGDLSPLAYLAGVIQGNPGLKVWTKEDGSRRLRTADIALQAANITPIRFAPKEALALANGTSVSAGAAALALQDAHGCIILSQILTAMAVEGLNGTDESFDPYLSKIRPHPGQKEAAENIRSFLKGSKLARKADTENANGLRQDRYALRTSPQWLGPEIENITLAHTQVVIECNSITDNPIVRDDGVVIQGGNFQALAVTSAMDKTRAALHTIGRMIFQQSTELMNPTMNNGLPPNLTADEPSCDFLLKGTDVASAAYQSELAYLSHGMTPFVMVAEHGNQSLNSLALVSTRYTHKAVDIFMQLCSNSLLTLCQALDLRAIQHEYVLTLEPLFTTSLPLRPSEWNLDEPKLSNIRTLLWTQFQSEFRQRTTLDHEDRVKAIMTTIFASAISISQEIPNQILTNSFITDLSKWSASITRLAIDLRKSIIDNHTMEKTLPLLGNASKYMYQFIRSDLNIPFLRNGTSGGPQNIPTFMNAEFGSSLGTFITRIYKSLKNGELMEPVMQCLREVEVDSSEKNGHVAMNGLAHSSGIVSQ